MAPTFPTLSIRPTVPAYLPVNSRQDQREASATYQQASWTHSGKALPAPRIGNVLERTSVHRPPRNKNPLKTNELPRKESNSYEPSPRVNFDGPGFGKHSAAFIVHLIGETIQPYDLDGITLATRAYKEGLILTDGLFGSIEPTEVYA